MRRWWRLAALGATLACVPACVTSRSADPNVLLTDTGTIRLEFVEWDESTAELLRDRVPVAAKALERWGGLTEPVQITVVNSRWELYEAIGRHVPAISAWARRNQVILWDPRWWPVPEPAREDPALTERLRQRQLTDLLEHELTHCLMFQRAGRSPSDPRDRIPFWFREGMATVTANEAADWPPPETLSQWLSAHPGVDLLRDGAKLSRTDPHIAYGAAYWAFDFLVRRYGDPTVLRVLDRVGDGDSFPDAFHQVLGITAESFGNDFRRYLGWRGFVPADRRPRS